MNRLTIWACTAVLAAGMNSSFAVESPATLAGSTEGVFLEDGPFGPAGSVSRVSAVTGDGSVNHDGDTFIDANIVMTEVVTSTLAGEDGFEGVLFEIDYDLFFNANGDSTLTVIECRDLGDGDPCDNIPGPGEVIDYWALATYDFSDLENLVFTYDRTHFSPGFQVNIQTTGDFTVVTDLPDEPEPEPEPEPATPVPTLPFYGLLLTVLGLGYVGSRQLRK